MDCLVVGANGLLGSNVVAAADRWDLDVAGTYHSAAPDFDVPLLTFDLDDTEAFDDLLREFDPDLVINCAAMTDVDGCENNPERAHSVNGEAPGVLAEQCAARSIDFFHVSTDYVFDGTARGPYEEADEPNPVQMYGESKLAGERAVAERGDDPVIVRLSFVWGIHRSSGDLTGFPAWVKRRLQTDESIPLFTDQRITPTRAGQAAETILELARHRGRGIFHVAATSCVTPYEFGLELTDVLDKDEKLLEKGSLTDVDRAATRPAFTCLDVSKAESTLGRSQPTLREDIEAAFGEL